MRKARDPTALATSNALENLLPELLLTPRRASVATDALLGICEATCRPNPAKHTRLLCSIW